MPIPKGLVFGNKQTKGRVSGVDEDVEMSEESIQEYEDLSGYGEGLKDKTQPT